MSERLLSAQVYVDSIEPAISTECFYDGLGIVRSLAPWIRFEKTERSITISKPERDYVVADRESWNSVSSDINVVLTNRHIAWSKDVEPNGGYSIGKLDSSQQMIGLAQYMQRANGKRVAIIKTNAISRPEFLVAHEVGHLFGVQLHAENMHCESKKCLMFPGFFAKSKVEKAFCDCCSNQLLQNSAKLRHVKSGKLSMSPNAKIF